MIFKDYINSLSDEGFVGYAKRAKTTPEYLTTHLVPGRKIPRPDLMQRLIAATQGGVSRREMLDHFYPPEKQEAVA